jgi:hypothetical protein
MVVDGGQYSHGLMGIIAITAFLFVEYMSTSALRMVIFTVMGIIAVIAFLFVE